MLKMHHGSASMQQSWAGWGRFSREARFLFCILSCWHFNEVIDCLDQGDKIAVEEERNRLLGRTEVFYNLFCWAERAFIAGICLMKVKVPDIPQGWSCSGGKCVMHKDYTI